MSEYANDYLRLWIRNGMPSSSTDPFKGEFSVCGKRSRTDTGNWTVCANSGDRHTKQSLTASEGLARGANLHG